MEGEQKSCPSFLDRRTPGQMMVIGFGFVILMGSFLLMTPLASANGNWTNFIDSLFTATSAVCVTGLVVVDTGLYWSFFGKVVIILLIQIGGVGFMSISTSVALILGKKINLRQRILIKEAMNQNELSGSVRLVIQVIKFTLLIELVGALIFSFVYIPEFGVVNGAGISIFHAISSFCNAGFDLMGGVTGQYTSIIKHYNNPIIVFGTASLIILGGLGFPVLIGIKRAKKFRELNLNSKMVICTTLILIFAGTVLVFLGEFDNAKSIANMNIWDKFQVSFFQSVTTRTAGFATVDLTKFRESTLFVMIILMFIGASPASTGGGIKTTTVAVIFMAVKAFLKNENEITVYKRRINIFIFRKALGVFVVGVVAVVIGTFVINISQNSHFTLLSSAFEVSSAFATVGLSLGGSNNLNEFGKILIALFMFAGRVGSLTIFTSFIHESKVKKVRFPEEKILVG